MIGYNINLHKSLLFLYIKNKHKEKEILDIPQFTTATKKIKFLGIDLIKLVKNIYNEHFKPLEKDIEKDKKMERYPMLIN